MASSKQRTTWAKVQREAVRRDKRAEKAARKEARKNAPPETGPDHEFKIGTLDDDAVVQREADAQSPRSLD